jgi:hypothetical protein
MALPPLAELSIFMGLVLVLSLYGLTVSGHFPAEFRHPSFKTAIGKTVLWATLANAALLAITAAAVAWRCLPLYATILAAGAMLLVAPLLLRPLPDSFVNGRGGLLLFAAIGLALALLARQCVA